MLNTYFKTTDCRASLVMTTFEKSGKRLGLIRKIHGCCGQVMAGRRFRVSLIFLMFLFCLDVYATSVLTLPTERSSFFELDDKGAAKTNKKGLPYQSKTDVIKSTQSFSPSNTAFFVIDPWNDMPGDFLNDYYGKITNKKILPLMTQVSAHQFPVYVFTNDCKAIQPIPYSCAIDEKFYALAEKHKNVHILSWQKIEEIKIETFIKELKRRGISNLIYTGFASNMCVIDRPVGMINMRQQGFSLYFIPDASAAVETKLTWKTGEIHHAMTQIISQSMGKLIQYSDIESALNT
jgi:hypothetical protein